MAHRASSDYTPKMLLLLTLFACGFPRSADDCLPTTGDNCSCTPQCMTEGQIRRAQAGGVCDLGCSFDTAGSSEPNWECGLSGNTCVVLE